MYPNNSIPKNKTCQHRERESRNHRKVIALCLTLLLIASAIPLNVKAHTFHAPIYINGNDDFTSENGVSSGNGSQNDPYIIENWDINASSHDGIQIKNTDKYFIIRNCFVHDGGKNYDTGNMTVIGHDGIYFYNVINGKIENCVIENNERGIYLSSSSNNTIINNTVYDNSYGIRFSNSNNEIVSNNISLNVVYGIYISYSTIIVSSDLIIQDSIELIESTIKINCSSDGQYGIIVNNGATMRILDNSVITAYNTNYEFRFLVNSGSVFEMRNSTITECGYNNGNDGRSGLTIKTNNAIIDNSTFYNNFFGIYLDSSNNNQITNNNIYENSKGIYIFYSNNNTIANNNVYSSNFDYGIRFVFSDSNQIINNNVYDNQYGLLLYYSSNNQIANNDVYGNDWHGIRISSSSNNQIANNNIHDNSNGISLSYSDNEISNNDIYSNTNYGMYISHSTIIVSSNLTINDSIELKHQSTLKMNCTSNGQYGITVNNRATMRILNNSVITAYNSNYKFNFLVNSGSTFEMRDSELSECGYTSGSNGESGLTIKTDNTIIENNEIHDNYYGIYLYYSDSHTVKKNEIYGNNYYGIRFFHSNSSDVIENKIYNTNNINGAGISLSYSNNNTIERNYIRNNGYGIYLSSSNNNTIINHSNFTTYDICDNNRDGIYISNSLYNNITNNEIYFNRDSGIQLESNSMNNTIANNEIYRNNVYGIEFHHDSDNNIIKKNKILRNDYGEIYSYSSINTIENCSLDSDIGYEFNVRGNSQITTVNTTFDGDNVNVELGSSLTVKNYLHVKVVDWNEEPLQNILVRVWDNNYIPFPPMFNGTTNSEGRVSWILLTDRVYYSTVATPNTTNAMIDENGEQWKYEQNPPYSKNPDMDIDMSTSHERTYKKNYP